MANAKSAVVRYWVSAGTKARGGWQLHKVVLDEDGQEADGGVYAEYPTKKLAHEAKDRLNKKLNKAFVRAFLASPHIQH